MFLHDVLWYWQTIFMAEIPFNLFWLPRNASRRPDPHPTAEYLTPRGCHMVTGVIYTIRNYTPRQVAEGGEKFAAGIVKSCWKRCNRTDRLTSEARDRLDLLETRE